MRSGTAGAGRLLLVVTLGAATLLPGCKSALLLNINNKPYPYVEVPESKLGVHLHATRFEFKTQPRPVVAGQPAIWLLKVVSKHSTLIKPDPVRNFQVVHTKPMHLVLVSKDLKWFNHIHPDYKDNGLFIIRPTLPRPGTYKLYADYTPQDGRQEVAQQEFPVNPVGGTSGVAVAAVPPEKLVADTADAAGWRRRRVAALPDTVPLDETTSSTPGNYEVSLQPIPAQLRAEQDMLLHLQVRDTSGHDVTDLQPYLGAMGHMVILSASSNIYLHTHPLDPDTVQGMLKKLTKAPPAFNNSETFFYIRFPKPGLYKLWAQFQHHDQILTAPFVLNVAPAPPAGRPQATDAAGHPLYTCPMHPDVISTDPNGVCPRCKMALVKKVK